MDNWNPPKFTFFEQPDGKLLAIDESGKPLACQPTLTWEVDEGGSPVVSDPWGNPINPYQIPPYTVHVVEEWHDSGNVTRVGVAVDANGMPVPLVPDLDIIGQNPSEKMVGVKFPDGSTADLPAYEGPKDFSVHVVSSGPASERGTTEYEDYEMVAVDADGVPLPIQPIIKSDTGDPSDPTSISAWWPAGTAISPPQYEFPKFSVHLEYQEAVERGASGAAPAPIAIGNDGKPLAIQPTFEVDPSNPRDIVAILPNGQRYDPPSYQFPPYAVHLEYPAASYGGHAAPIPNPIAVDYQGNPLPVQPHLEVDPTDHTQVKATSLDGASIPVEAYHPQKDFYVHVEASGLADEHGRPQYAATAVDTNGQPLPIQPHLEVDPLDPTQVTAKFPDGSSYEPPNLYPPAGDQPDVWPPPADESSEELKSQPGVEQEEADQEIADTEEAVTADEEDPGSFQAEKSYAGVELEEGPVAQDDDWNDEEATGTTEDGLPAAGVDSTSEGIRATTTGRADEAAGPSRTERSESPEAEGMPVAEPEEFLVESLTTVGDQPEAEITEPDEVAFKFSQPAEPAGEEIEVEVLEIEALEEPAPILEEEPVESPSGERRPVVEVEALEIAEQAMVAGLDETETPTGVAEPIETAAAPTELEPLEQTGSLSAFDTVPPLGEAAVGETPVEDVPDLTMAIEEIEALELDVIFEPVEPLDAGMELIEVEELDGGLPGDRYEQSVPEDPEPEEEQQT